MFVSGHGACTPTFILSAYFCFSLGLDAGTTTRLLGLSESTVNRIFSVALEVVATDVQSREATVEFGKLPGGFTADVEADEKSFKKWQSPGDDGMKFYWYPYVLVTQRGSQSKTVMRPMGVTSSTNRARAPPLKVETWTEIVNELFCEGARINLMTDGAVAYALVDHPAISSKFRVIHEQKEYVRSADILSNPDLPVADGQFRSGKLGCQKAEGAWHHISKYVPDSLHAPMTDKAMHILDLHIRRGQWMYILSTDDPWPRFSAAASNYSRGVLATSGNKVTTNLARTSFA